MQAGFGYIITIMPMKYKYFAVSINDLFSFLNRLSLIIAFDRFTF